MSVFSSVPTAGPQSSPWKAFGAQFGRDALKGAFRGFLTASLRNGDVGKGALKGAYQGVIGSAVTTTVGLAYGYYASGGKSPRWHRGAFFFRATKGQPEGTLATVIGFAAIVKSNVHDAYFEGYAPHHEDPMFSDVYRLRATQVINHELGHVEQYKSFGAHYLPMYGSGLLLQGFDFVDHYMEHSINPSSSQLNDDGVHDLF